MKFTLALISCAATALFAQGPGGFRGHPMEAAAHTTEVQNYLGLTDAQITSLKQLRQSEMTALKPIFQQMQPLRENLRTQSQSSSADATAVGKLVLSMQALEQQAAPIRSSYQQQAQAILTADQKTKLTALQNAAALMPAIHEAMGLNLLTPPVGPDGPGGLAAEMHMRGGGPR